MIDRILYLLALALIRFLQALSLPTVARLGRCGGALAYWLDVRHRRVAMRNLIAAFAGEKDRAEIRAIARENFKRIGESYCCAIKTAGMTFEELRPFVAFVGAEKILPQPGELGIPSRVVAIGHFGNFELYARFGQFAPVFQGMTTYRGLPQPSLNRLLQSLREKSGCLFFERRTDGAALKAAMNTPGKMLGLLCDQHAGTGGLRLPFFGRECSTSSAPAVFALRYHCRLFPGFCFRTGLGRWSLEAGEEIPTHIDGQPRPSADIMLDVNHGFEAAIRRDPANWFWVHNRWKPTAGLKVSGSRFQVAKTLNLKP
jgi:KDO2-lipid IV(A) lauroyltransferase